jgi:hypothetical protein
MFFPGTHVGGVNYGPKLVLETWHKLMTKPKAPHGEDTEIYRDTHIVLAAAPAACRDLLALVVRQTVMPNVTLQPEQDVTLPMLETLTILINTLAVMQSVVGLIPMNAIPYVREASRRLEQEYTAALTPPDMRVLRSLSPEVAKALSQATHIGVALRKVTASFFIGLCDKILKDFGLAKVEVPPFEPIPFSYDPPNTGVALYFTDTGQQGRYPRRYRHASVTEYAAATERATEKVKCHKNFVSHRNRTGGVFRCVRCAVPRSFIPAV